MAHLQEKYQLGNPRIAWRLERAECYWWTNAKGKQDCLPLHHQKEILWRIHDRHLGITRCRERTNQEVWWPRISKDLQDRIVACKNCHQKSPVLPSETLMPLTLHDRPFQRNAVYICEMKGQNYLVYVDKVHWHSQAQSTTPVPSSTEGSFVSQHGIGEIAVLDNGRQFTSGEFQKLDKDWNIFHITSSPHLLSIKRRGRKSNEKSQGHPATERLLHCLVNPMKYTAPFIRSEPSRTRLWMQTQKNSTYSASSTHSSHRVPWYGVKAWWVWEGTTEARPRLSCTCPSEVEKTPFLWRRGDRIGSIRERWLNSLHPVLSKPLRGNRRHLKLDTTSCSKQRTTTTQARGPRSQKLSKYQDTWHSG